MISKKVKIIREVKKYGTSLGIRLGMDLINQLGIKEGSVVEAEINKVDRFDESEFFIICPRCETPIIVHEEEEIIDCPVCGKTELRVNELQRKNGN